MRIRIVGNTPSSAIAVALALGVASGIFALFDTMVVVRPMLELLRDEAVPWVALGVVATCYAIPTLIMARNADGIHETVRRFWLIGMVESALFIVCIGATVLPIFFADSSGMAQFGSLLGMLMIAGIGLIGIVICAVGYFVTQNASEKKAAAKPASAE